ncbi:MAG: hypothetical protein ACFCUV_21910 [Rivularia sp. (in: cyanobacteria)]
MLKKQHHYPGKLLGAGRSGKVFLVDTPEGLVARKIFYADKLASIIQYFLLGTVNPYIWNENAIKSAFYRRRILSALVEFWFGDKLKIAKAIATCWNPEFKAYQMDTEFISGRHVALRQPCNRERLDEFPALVYDIMLPLQKKLIAAGLDGLVWQAGKGTPTALNNFLLANDTLGKKVFVWIDLESGVPALFPSNLLALFSFYLPKAFKYGKPLFDDVNTNKLSQYLNSHRREIELVLGSQEYEQILEDVYQLEQHQLRWKSMSRVDGSIGYQLKKGLINQQQAEWYSQHPLLWYTRELFKIARESIYWLLIKLPMIVIHKLTHISYRKIIYKLCKFTFSQRYRFYLAKNYINKRVVSWQDRKQLSHEEAVNLLESFQQDSSSDYLNDFSVHLGIKLFVKSLEYLLVPLLYFVGLIDEFILITWLIVGGPVYRTIYTFPRILGTVFTGKEIPWVAFLVGLIPTFGTLAYPCQIIYSAKGRKKRIAQFIVYDFLSRIGEKIPAWGGEDTHTEHLFNRLADKIAYRKTNITTNYLPNNTNS